MSETLVSADGLSWVTIDARPNADDLRRATLTVARGLEALMSERVIAWSLPDLPDESWRRAKTSS